MHFYVCTTCGVPDIKYRLWCSSLACAFVLLASEPLPQKRFLGSEDLSAFLMEQGVPTAYLHSGVKPMQRLELLRQLRSGEIDVIVGVNLLREVCITYVRNAPMFCRCSFAQQSDRFTWLRKPRLFRRSTSIGLSPFYVSLRHFFPGLFLRTQVSSNILFLIAPQLGSLTRDRMVP